MDQAGTEGRGTRTQESLPWSEPSPQHLGHPGTCSCRTWRGPRLWIQSHSYRDTLCLQRFHVSQRILWWWNTTAISVINRSSSEERLPLAAWITQPTVPGVSGAVIEEIHQAGKEVGFWGKGEWVCTRSLEKQTKTSRNTAVIVHFLQDTRARVTGSNPGKAPCSSSPSRRRQPGAVITPVWLRSALGPPPRRTRPNDLTPETFRINTCISTLSCPERRALGLEFMNCLSNELKSCTQPESAAGKKPS